MTRTNPIRTRVGAALDGTGAFLRCDRGGALYVTNLPSRRADWRERAAALEAAKVRCEARGGLLFLTPEPGWAAAFAAWAEESIAVGALTRQLDKRRGMPLCAQEEACWIEGLKRLELNDAGDYERTLRQTAAVALRKRCGGLLYACGLCLDLMKAGGQ